MDNHKGQTKYSITLNNDTSDIVKITRAEPGNVPGRWGSEKEVKLDSISEDIYGTSKQEVNKLYDEAANPKIGNVDEEEEEVVETKEDEEEVVETKEDEEEVVETKEDEEAAVTAEKRKEDNKPTTPVVEDDEVRKRKEKAALASDLARAVEKRRTLIGEGRKTRKDKKRTTRKKIRKGAHGKSNKKGRKNTRGKR